MIFNLHSVAKKFEDRVLNFLAPLCILLLLDMLEILNYDFIQLQG